MAFNVVAIVACVIGVVVNADVVAAVVGIVVEKASDDAMVTDADADAEEPLVPIDPRAVEAPRA